MPGSFRLFRVAGIDIEVNISWLIILALLTSSLALQWFPGAAKGYSPAAYWTLGLVAALALFASVLVHELAHSLVARSRGMPVKSITLFIFGGVSNLEREPRSADVEFQMALVGPVASAIIGGVALGVWALVGSASPLLAAMLLYLGASNLLLAVFNMIPGFPLDGGRVLRSLIWKATGSLRRATLWAARIGQGVAILLILVGVWMFFAVSLIDGLWFGFIGWFLLQAAQAENTQVMMETLLKGVTVRQVMSPPPAVAQGDVSLQQLVDAYLLPSGIRSIPIMSGDTFIGLTTLEDIRRVPRERWPVTSARETMTPVEKLRMARGDESLNDAMPRLVAGNVNQLPVVDESGQLIGMLNRDTILRYLEVRRGLEVGDGRWPAERVMAPDAPHTRSDERTPATS
ncbi:MAG: site-2 protease family protein [Chloroflexota bacterium]|nr:site-2 protease family protein [Chloroflexota bacterium]